MAATSDKKRVLTFLSFALTLLFASYANSQTCQTHTFPTNHLFASCVDLPVLNSFLHWTHDTPTNTLQIAFRRAALPSSSWTAWAINPTSTGMVGSQAFVAFLTPNGSIKAYTSPVTQYATMLAQGELNFPVDDVSASYVDGEMTIFASFGLPDNRTKVNQLWQTGQLVNGYPKRHRTDGDNVFSRGTLDLLAASVAVNGGATSRIATKNAHGFMNTLSWGLMMPIGAMAARYLKVAKAADPAWFYLHASCQSTAYIIGIAGFLTGIKLGNSSYGIDQYTHHRSIGIALVFLATLQILALFLRPNKDHKHRPIWSIYHRCVGYLVIILSLVNVVKGFGILKPKGEYIRAYVGVVSTLAVAAAVLEVVTWVVVIRRRKEEEEEKMMMMRSFGAGNGYGGRQRG
ncbi:unnamed protein product [Rhodiola kirilowii]